MFIFVILLLWLMVYNHFEISNWIFEEFSVFILVILLLGFRIILKFQMGFLKSLKCLFWLFDC